VYGRRAVTASRAVNLKKLGESKPKLDAVTNAAVRTPQGEQQ
jgi:hypothetical protein